MKTKYSHPRKKDRSKWNTWEFYIRGDERINIKKFCQNSVAGFRKRGGDETENYIFEIMSENTKYKNEHTKYQKKEREIICKVAFIKFYQCSIFWYQIQLK